jgi:uncharacterized damage-inducible protein DinB
MEQTTLGVEWLAYLESTKKGVLDATKGLSEAQWNFQPAPGKWSVAECVEHIAATEDFIRGPAVGRVEADVASTLYRAPA